MNKFLKSDNAGKLKYAIVVCWKCKNNRNPLEQVIEKGKKTDDYICSSCKQSMNYLPNIGNSSRIRIRYD